MPTVALHSHYWAGTTGGPEQELGASSAGGYVPWQTTILTHHGVAASVLVWTVLIPAMLHGAAKLGT